MKRLLATLVLVAFGAAVGCGGGSGKKTDGGGAGGTGGTSVNANCSSFTACGGAIQGTWNYVSGCGSFSSATCPSEMTLTTLGSGAMAVYTFGAGGAFSYTASGSVNEMISYALGCISAVTDAGIPQACADLQNLYRMSVVQADAGSSSTITSATCSAGQNQACVCTLVVNTQPQQTGSGSYTVSGNQVTITTPAADGGAPTPTVSDFCVSGNTLTLNISNDSGSTFLLTFSR